MKEIGDKTAMMQNYESHPSRLLMLMLFLLLPPPVDGTYVLTGPPLANDRVNHRM